MATNIVIPDSVLKELNTFPKEIRLKFWEQLERLISNPFHPSLRNEKLKGAEQWAFSITMQYRATYFRDRSNLIVTAVGTTKKS